MMLSEFATKSTDGRKIVLANRVSYANSLFRRLNIQHGIDIFNIEAMTLSDVAKELYIGYCAVKGEKFPQILDSDESLYVFDELLHHHECKTLAAQSLTLTTVRDILNCINELRQNDLTDDYGSDGGAKVTEIKEIIAVYEDTLNERELYDTSRLYSKSIEILEGIADQKELSLYLPYLSKGAVLGNLISNKWSDVEERLIALLTKFLRFNDEQGLYELEDYMTDIDLKKALENKDINIYRAYGCANEVRQVAFDIKNCKTNIYGDVQVFYTSPEYLNYVKASFDADEIPYVISNGYPATELNLTQLMLALIAAARENYSYELLENVCLNPAVTFENVAESDSVYINPVAGYNDALSKGIGWSKERYIEYQKRTQKEAEDAISEVSKDDSKTQDEKEYIVERQKGKEIFADFLTKFVDVFDHEKSASKILLELWEFVRLYTYKKNRERGKLSESIYTQVKRLEYYDKERSFEDRLTLIEDFLNQLTVNDEPEPGAVAISVMKGIQVVERSLVYILGLSAGKLSVDTKQSPILLDDEKRRYIKNAGKDTCPVVLAGEKNSARRKDICRTLEEINNGGITFLYNDYDTTALRQSSPSVFLWEIAEELGIKEKDFKEAIGYPIVKDDIRIDADDLQKGIYDYGEKKRKEAEENRKKSGKEVLKKKKLDSITISATGLQTFLSCPLAYYYSYVNGLKVYDQKSPSGATWLTAFTKGNLCHYSMEKYFSELMPPKAPFTGKVDEVRLREIVSECAKEIEMVEPYMSKAIRDKEEQYYYDKMLSYLKDRVSCWQLDNQWKVIGCEIAFEGVEYECVSKKGEHLKLSFNGSIDRMDGYIDDDKWLHLRILDYKTGKKESKLDEVDKGVQIQHYLYGIAAVKYIKDHQEELRKIFEVEKFAGYSFDEIGYEFPYESKENYGLSVTFIMNGCGNVLSGGLDDLKIDFQENTKDLMCKVLGAYQAGNLKDIPAECDKFIDQSIENELKRKLDKENKKIRDRFEKNNKPINDLDLLKIEDVRMKYTLKDYCKERYCDYKDVCRRWVGGIEYEQSDE